MQELRWSEFQLLTEEQIKALGESSSESLREFYITILTVLHDSLGKYSSGGTPSTLLDVRDVDHLLSNALLGIRAAGELDSIASALNETAVRNINEARKLTYLSEVEKTLSRKMSMPVDNFIDSLRDEYNRLRKPSLTTTPVKDSHRKERPHVSGQPRLRK